MCVCVINTAFLQRTALSYTLMLSVYIRILRNIETFLAAFTKLRKSAINCVMSVCTCTSVSLSAWNNSAPTGRIFLKFGICVFFQKSVKKIQVLLRCDGKIGYFTRRRIYIYDTISLNNYP